MIKNFSKDQKDQVDVDGLLVWVNYYCWALKAALSIFLAGKAWRLNILVDAFLFSCLMKESKHIPL